jgi:hypothetical protein
MSISQVKVERTSETHVLGTAQLAHSKGTEEVHFVAPKPAEENFDGEQKLDHEARYFSSPLIARTSWEDLSKSVDIVPAFTGRSLTLMQEHLAKNFKA